VGYLLPILNFLFILNYIIAFDWPPFFEILTSAPQNTLAYPRTDQLSVWLPFSSFSFWQLCFVVFHKISHSIPDFSKLYTWFSLQNSCATKLRKQGLSSVRLNFASFIKFGQMPDLSEALNTYFKLNTFSLHSFIIIV